MIDKRENRRFMTNRMVTSIAKTSEGFISQVSMIMDLSASGLQISSNMYLAPGTPILTMITFINDNGQDDESALFGMVAWSFPHDDIYHIGITMDSVIMPGSDRGLLNYYIGNSI